MNEHFGRLVGDYLIQQEIKEERLTLAQRVIAFLGLACLIVLTLVAATYPNEARADTRKFENQQAVVRFFDTPCELDVPEKKDLRAAHGTFTMMARTPFGLIPLGREDFNGCWKRGANGYESVWDDGEKITFPAAEVHPEGV